jgi:hypothetical protein
VTVATLVAVSAVGAASDASGGTDLYVPAPGSPVPVGRGSGEVFLVDLNRDGHLDLVTKHLLERRLSVRLGDGNGRFAPGPVDPVPFDYQPGTIALGDVDGDGRLDLGVTSRDDAGEHVHLLRGDGTGRFQPFPAAQFTVSASIQTYKPRLHLVDLNGDARTDVVAANGRRNTVELLLADGKGGFSPAPVVSLAPGGNLYTFGLGDVDGDRRPDLVVASAAQPEGTPGRVFVKRGDGKGGFEDVPGFVSVPPSPRLGVLADVDGDTRLDVVLTHDDASRVSVLVNRGSGRFAPSPGSPHEIGAPAFGLVVADVDGDRRNDLVAATVKSVTVLRGTPDGFAPVAGSPFPAGPGAYNLDVGDLDEDGKLDVVASAFEGEAMTVLLGR